MAQESEKSNRETKPDASPKPIRGVLEFLIKFVAQVSREMSNITTHSCDRTIIMLGVLNSPLHVVSYQTAYGMSRLSSHQVSPADVPAGSLCQCFDVKKWLSCGHIVRPSNDPCILHPSHSVV